MKLLNSILDEVQVYLTKSILEPDVEFEYKYMGQLSKEKFKNLMDYCKNNYDGPETSITLDITFQNSDLRVTLDDLHSIKSYCKSDVLDKSMNISYMEKKKYENKSGIKRDSIKFNLKREVELDEDSYQVEDVKKSWKNKNKFFRYKYRNSYTTSDKLFRIDITASKILQNVESYELEIEYIGNVKNRIYDFIHGNISEVKPEQSKKKKKYESIEKPKELEGIQTDKFIPSITDVFNRTEYKMDKKPKDNSIEEYQLEVLKMFINNTNIIKINKAISKSFGLGDISEVKPKLNYSNDRYNLDYDIIKKRKDVDVVYKNMELVLEKDPDSLDDVLEILDDTIYDLHTFIYDTDILMSNLEKNQILQKYYKLSNQANTRYKKLMAPQPVTLTKKNININNPKNILKNYFVTEKADGDRYILFIDDKQNGYLISNKQEVVSTGLKFPDLENEWILDGEYIRRDKHNRKINLYMIFDVYLSDGEPVYRLPFKSGRQNELYKFMEKLSDSKKIDENSNIRIELKEYRRK